MWAAVETARVGPAAAGAVRTARLDGVDLLRGAVMVLMALDHVRAFFWNGAFDPVDLDATTPAWFLTRWVTHFVAPVFVFLAGTAAFLYGTRGKTRLDVARFLVTRGAWLVVLELTLITFTWAFVYDPSFLVGQVIWAIGWSMIALAGLVLAASPRAIAALGIGVILVHNSFDGVAPAAFGSLAWLWVVLHVGGALPIVPGVSVMVFYPLVPWIGVMAAGYGFGEILRLPPEKRSRLLVRLGLALTAAFVVLRATNLYGDPSRWSEHGSALLTALSFLNTTKYPPSLLFLLMTLGPALAVLPAIERLRGLPRRFLLEFGRVPLFFYVVHLAFIHALAVVAYAAAGADVEHLTSLRFFLQPPPWGYGTPMVYVVWVGVVLLLFLPSAWFAGVKRRRRDWWLSYL